jgi:transcriptional regulator with XRE-family HTH domain
MSFGAMLTRLMAHRQVSVDDLGARPGITESELTAVLGGANPSPEFLARLAPALDLHDADVYAIASIPVPAELAPVDPSAGRLVDDLVRRVLELPVAAVSELRQAARSMPRQSRAEPSAARPAWKQYEPGFGTVIVRMLENRNLDWMPAVYVLALMTSRYLSQVTIGSIGRGRAVMTAAWLADFAVVLGIPVGDLAALGGIDMLAEVVPPTRRRPK